MIFVHIKNYVNGAFGLLKLIMKKVDPHYPRDMYKLIDESGDTNVIFPATDVRWTDWNLFLSEIFELPPRLNINSYCNFYALHSSSRILFASIFSSDG